MAFLEALGRTNALGQFLELYKSERDEALRSRQLALQEQEAKDIREYRTKSLALTEQGQKQTYELGSRSATTAEAAQGATERYQKGMLDISAQAQDVAKRRVAIEEGAEKRIAEVWPEQKTSMIEAARTARVKAKAEAAAIEQREAMLNAKTDYTTHPMYQSLVPEQKKYIDGLVKRMGVIDADGMATNRSLMDMIGMLETDKKMFDDFAMMGINSRKQNLQILYDDLNKATASGNTKKVAELNAQISTAREQLDQIIKVKSDHDERLELFSKLSDPMKDYIITKYMGMQNWDPKTAKIDEKEFLEFSGQRYLGLHPDRTLDKIKGELTENQVLENIDMIATERGGMHLKPTLYNEYLTLRSKGTSRAEAYNTVITKYFGGAGASTGTPTPGRKNDIGKGLWK